MGELIRLYPVEQKPEPMGYTITSSGEQGPYRVSPADDRYHIYSRYIATRMCQGEKIEISLDCLDDKGLWYRINLHLECGAYEMFTSNMILIDGKMVFTDCQPM